MRRAVRTSILGAVAFTAFAAPVMAATTNYTVAAQVLRLRTAPSGSAKVASFLKRNTPLVAEGKCRGGWMKVASVDGHLSGYVARWALTEARPQAATLPAAPHTTGTLTEKREMTPAVIEENPTNEQLAIQITNLRLDVLYLNRQIDEVRSEVKKIKISLAHNARDKQLPAADAREHRVKLLKGERLSLNK